jgi:hypothetical protein
MRTLPCILSIIGTVGIALAQEAQTPATPPPIVEPGATASGSSHPAGTLPLAMAPAPQKPPKSAATQTITDEDAKRMMMLMMMRDAASGLPAILLRPAD